MSAVERLNWYLRRLMRMSPAEIAHRVAEQTKRALDARTQWRWSDFGKVEGPLRGLPGVNLSRVETLRPTITDEVSRLRTRSFHLLNQVWPRTPDWDSVWHLDPVTGSQWPGAGTFAFHSSYRHERNKGDVKFVWEVNRLQFLPVLALAKEVDLLAEVLASWMAKNPPFRGINWTSGIEAASRVVSVLATVALLDGDARARLDVRVRAFLDAHLFWIRRYPSLYSSANNHRVAELVASFLAAICAPGMPDSTQLLAGARQGLQDRMLNLFHPDGVGTEQSVTYAAYALEWFALAGIAADTVNLGFSADYKARAARAAAWLRWLMDETGSTPAIGDGDETRVLALRQEPETRYAASVVALVARWLGAPELSAPATDVQLRDLWGASEIQAAALLPAGLRTFDQGGYTVFRDETPRGQLVCIFDHGPLGFESIAAHGHADALSVWLSWGNEPIFVDAGTYLYHSGGVWRDRFRSTAVHNTLTLDGRDQSSIAGPFNWSSHARARIVERNGTSLTAEHDGYATGFGLTHRRTVSMISPYSFVINDTLIGIPRVTLLKWRNGLTVAPGIHVERSERAMILTTPNGRVLHVTAKSNSNPLVEELASYSPAFGKMIEANRIVMSGPVSPDGTPAIALQIECIVHA